MPELDAVMGFESYNQIAPQVTSPPLSLPDYEAHPLSKRPVGRPRHADPLLKSALQFPGLK